MARQPRGSEAAGSASHLPRDEEEEDCSPTAPGTQVACTTRVMLSQRDVATAEDSTRRGEGGEIPQLTRFSCPSVLGHCLPIGYLYPEAWGQKSVGNISHGTEQSGGRGEGIR